MLTKYYDFVGIKILYLYPQMVSTEISKHVTFVNDTGAKKVESAFERFVGN